MVMLQSSSQQQLEIQDVPPKTQPEVHLLQADRQQFVLWAVQEHFVHVQDHLSMLIAVLKLITLANFSTVVILIVGVRLMFL